MFDESGRFFLTHLRLYRLKNKMIEVKNLTKHFGEIKVLDGISFSVSKREILCLVGTNGAGRTTVLRLLAGVLKPDSGTIVMDDMPVYDNNNTKQHIFFIPSDPYFFWGAKPRDMGTFFAEKYTDFDSKRFLELLNICGIDCEARISKFSKALKTLLMLACGLATSPKYLLIDDVLDELNSEERECFAKLLGEELTGGYMTPIIASSDFADIQKLFTEEMEDTGYVLKEFALGEE